MCGTKRTPHLAHRRSSRGDATRARRAVHAHRLAMPSRRLKAMDTTRFWGRCWMQIQIHPRCEAHGACVPGTVCAASGVSAHAAHYAPSKIDFQCAGTRLYGPRPIGQQPLVPKGCRTRERLAHFPLVRPRRRCPPPRGSETEARKRSRPLVVVAAHAQRPWCLPGSARLRALAF